MLRLTRTTRLPQEVTLLLEGQIVAEWVELLEAECLTLLRTDQKVLLDLSGVSYLDRRAASYTITNGVYLSKWFDRLDQLRLKSLSCSLNAASEHTHQEVMGLGAGEFPRIVEHLRALAAGQVTKKPVSVSITLVVTQQNIHEIPAFIELGHEIRAATIYVRTLLPQARVESEHGHGRP